MILVFGSINIDVSVAVERLPGPGETVQGPVYGMHPGGKGANQALAARRAGAEVALVGRCGQDAFAELALAELRMAGVALSVVASAEQRTGCALIAVDRHGENQIVVACGANSLARADDIPARLLGRGSLLLLQMEVPIPECWTAARQMRRAGGRTLLNLAPAEPLSEETLRLFDWLIVNEGEAAVLADGLGLAASDPLALAEALARRSGGGTVVTLGAAGAVAAENGRRWRIGALPVEVRDTTAAGDAFVGVFAAALAAGADVADALRRAAVAGGLTCTRAGAQPSLPDAEAIELKMPCLDPAAEV